MEYQIEILRSETEPDLYQNLMQYLKDWHKKIGQEQMEFRMESLICDWCMDRGYQMAVVKDFITLYSPQMNYLCI